MGGRRYGRVALADPPLRPSAQPFRLPTRSAQSVCCRCTSSVTALHCNATIALDTDTPVCPCSFSWSPGVCACWWSQCSFCFCRAIRRVDSRVVPRRLAHAHLIRHGTTARVAHATHATGAPADSKRSHTDHTCASTARCSSRTRSLRCELNLCTRHDMRLRSLQLVLIVQYCLSEQIQAHIFFFFDFFAKRLSSRTKHSRKKKINKV